MLYHHNVPNQQYDSGPTNVLSTTRNHRTMHKHRLMCWVRRGGMRAIRRARY